jgi:hypothetical protein
MSYGYAVETLEIIALFHPHLAQGWPTSGVVGDRSYSLAREPASSFIKYGTAEAKNQEGCSVSACAITGSALLGGGGNGGGDHRLAHARCVQGMRGGASSLAEVRVQSGAAGLRSRPLF